MPHRWCWGKRIQAGRQVVESLTDNPNFPEAGPWRELLLAATDELEASYNDAQSSRQITTSKISFQHEKAKEFNRIMAVVARKIATASDLDPTKILSAGFNLCDANKAIGPLPAPTGFVVSPGAQAGAMEFYWNKVRGALTYTIRYALDGAGELQWATVSSTRLSAQADSLTSGRKYLFCVAAVGAAGQSPWSQPGARFAP